MSLETQHISISIARSAADVYAYASDPRNLPEWAAGLSSDIQETAGRWVAASPMGRVFVEFTPANDLGVLDHHVTLPSGETVYNPVRVIPDGAHCEVVFTLRRREDMSQEEFHQDAARVAADLAQLKQLLEARGAHVK